MSVFCRSAVGRPIALFVAGSPGTGVRGTLRSERAAAKPRGEKHTSNRHGSANRDKRKALCPHILDPNRDQVSRDTYLIPDSRRTCPWVQNLNTKRNSVPMCWDAVLLCRGRNCSRI